MGRGEEEERCFWKRERGRGTRRRTKPLLAMTQILPSPIAIPLPSPSDRLPHFLCCCGRKAKVVIGLLVCPSAAENKRKEAPRRGPSPAPHLPTTLGQGQRLRHFHDNVDFLSASHFPPFPRIYREIFILQGMASLTHPAHHRHQSAHAHGSPPFSAIRFHPLDLAAAAAANGAPSGGQSSVASLNPSPLVYAAASHLPTISAHHQAVPSSILVHAPGPLHHHQNPFGPLAAAFAGSLLAGRPPLLANGQHFLDGTTILSATNGQSAIMLNADGSAPSMIAFGQSKEPVAAAALVDNSPPQLSVASLSSSSFGPDSDGRSCSSSSCPGGTSNSAMLATQANGEPQVHEGAPAIGQSNEEGGGRQQGKGAMIGSRKQLVRDEAYWERRRKNNDAAKRSRDSRRKKEDEVAVRAVILEQENLRLRFELERLRTEIERHRIVAFSQGMAHQQQQDGNGAKFGGDQQQLSAAAAAFLCPSTHPMALAAAAAAAAAMANAGGNGLMVVPVTRENGEMPTISTTSSASSSSSSAN